MQTAENANQKHPWKSTTHEERFYHFQGNKDTGQKFKAMTVFARKETIMDEPVWYMSVAFCVAGDQFEKRIGRQIARRKYFMGPQHRYVLGSEITFEGVKAGLYDVLRAHMWPAGHDKPY
jgi:hypothetical protein